MRKHYNYLQGKLKQKLFTKIIRFPSLEAWVERPGGHIKRVQALYSKTTLIKVDNV
jgi:hypothetical protein